jgi:hypothetical protein
MVNYLEAKKSLYLALIYRKLQGRAGNFKPALFKYYEPAVMKYHFSYSQKQFLKYIFNIIYNIT